LPAIEFIAFLIRQIDSDDRFSAKTAFPPCARA